MATRAVIRRALISWAAEQTSFGDTLILRLKYCRDARCSATSTGLVLIGASANGSSSNKAFIPNSQDINPIELMALWQTAIELYATVLAELTTIANPTPSDEQILAGMLSATTFIKTVQNDYALLEAI